MNSLYNRLAERCRPSEKNITKHHDMNENPQPDLQKRLAEMEILLAEAQAGKARAEAHLAAVKAKTAKIAMLSILAAIVAVVALIIVTAAL
ncbi:hypothetical protein [Neisseria dentiae]|uniref:hypothetical protein n=2 Tax=Neisseriaceae TaxID=481 RepID=UPI0035A01AF9